MHDDLSGGKRKPYGHHYNNHGDQYFCGQRPVAQTGIPFRRAFAKIFKVPYFGFKFYLFIS